MRDEPILIFAREGSGLFALYFLVLSVIEKHPGRTPVVYFGRDCLYFTPEGRRGSRNAWEYYFKPTARVSAQELLGLGPDDLAALSGAQLVELAVARGLTALRYPLYGGCASFIGEVREECRPALSTMARRHIGARDELVQAADRYAERCFAGRRVVGVHYRATDKSAEAVSLAPHLGHAAVTHTIDEYLDQVPDDADCVYLATDSRQGQERARQRLGARVLCRSVQRSTDGRAVHFGAHRAAAGEEVVLDWLLLSRCAHLVHGLSCVSGAALVENPALRHTDMTLRFPVKDPRALVLPVGAATLYGDRTALRPHDEGGTIVSIWDHAGTYLAWDVDSPAAARYRVEIRYASHAACPRARYTVGIEGGDTVEAEVRSTCWSTWVVPCDWTVVGHLQVPAGRHQLALRAAGDTLPMMALHSIRLMQQGC